MRGIIGDYESRPRFFVGDRIPGVHDGLTSGAEDCDHIGSAAAADRCDKSVKSLLGRSKGFLTGGLRANGVCAESRDEQNSEKGKTCNPENSIHPCVLKNALLKWHSISKY